LLAALRLAGGGAAFYGPVNVEYPAEDHSGQWRGRSAPPLPSGHGSDVGDGTVGAPQG